MITRTQIKEWLDDVVTRTILLEFDRLYDANKRIQSISTLEELYQLKGAHNVIREIANPINKLKDIIKDENDG